MAINYPTSKKETLWWFSSQMNNLHFGWSLTGVSTVLYSAMADPDLQIKGLGGGAVSKNVFSALRASFWSNNKRGGGGAAPPPGPPPASVTAERRRMHVLLNGKVYVYNRNVCDYE